MTFSSAVEEKECVCAVHKLVALKPGLAVISYSDYLFQGINN